MARHGASHIALVNDVDFILRSSTALVPLDDARTCRVLSACDGYGENGDGFSGCVDALTLNSVKAELDDGTSSTWLLFLTVLLKFLDSRRLRTVYVAYGGIRD